MHFEILVEDQSGKKALDIIMQRIIDNEHTYKVIAYKGIGRIPNNIRDAKSAANRILLENLPKLLKGYGRTFAGYGSNYQAAVIIVCDLDKKCLKSFREELFNILKDCNPKPVIRFCIAIEEFEAWFLGDISAITLAYPNVNSSTLSAYVNDSICGTWEVLANAVFPGGAQRLLGMGWQAIGSEKFKWAESIAPHMCIDNNNSPSFCYFRDKLRELPGMFRQE
ncbi:MAG: DUF4276 family protein [Chitinivibrionales bacterium]|nr:DUF4276 family protein [Chitinivibrionales bacterium]